MMFKMKVNFERKTVRLIAKNILILQRREIFLIRPKEISNKRLPKKLNPSVHTVGDQIHKAPPFLKSAYNNH